jgi:hypothetical protein
MRRRTIIAFSILVLFAAGALLGACGDGNKPAVTPGTLLPSASGTPASPGASPGAASPSPSAATLTPGASPSATTGGSEITDASIKAGILRRIAESPALSGLRIRVVVIDKKVLLKGNVKTAEQKNAVEQIAVTEPGIAKVVSYLIVEPKGDGGY